MSLLKSSHNTVLHADVATFSAPPRCSSLAVIGPDLTNKTYVDGAIAASGGATGPTGPAGPVGATGPAGATGPVAPASAVTTTLSNVNATVFPTFVSATSGDNPILVDSGFTYNPSVGDIAIENMFKITNQAFMGGNGALSVGYNAGLTSQGQGAIAIGSNAGTNSQSPNSVAIGRFSGNSSQSENTVAVGNNSGRTSQSLNAVAVGNLAGNSNQGPSAVAIGSQAGQTSQHDNSVIINATGSSLNSNGVSRFFVKPIRGVALGIGIGSMVYDPATGEITYSTT